MKVAEIGKIATVLDVEPGEILTHLQAGTERPATGEAADGDVRISLHPGFGFMRGLIKVEEGFDVTGPYGDAAWDEGYLGEDRL